MAGELTGRRYTKVAIGLHWAIATLIVLGLATGLLHDDIEESFGASPMWIHKSVGLTVLLLTIARAGWRLVNHAPPLPQSLSRWQRSSSGAVHLLLYSLMLAVPLTGWVRSSASGYPLRWFEFIDIPKFAVSRGSVEAQIASTAHELLGWALIALAALHVAAALYHHLVLRDQVLQRMLP
jgi:cytochrome b561